MSEDSNWSIDKLEYPADLRRWFEFENAGLPAAGVGKPFSLDFSGRVRPA